MPCLRRLVNLAGLVMIAVTFMVVLAGCGDDFGTSCTLPDNDQVRAACSGNGAQSSASCVVKNIIQCDSRVCGVYRDPKASLEGFCTQSCESDGDCPGDAFCDEFVVGTGQSYCVLSRFEGR
jgi:hypothetical protein